MIRSVLARIPPHLGTETRAEVEAELAGWLDREATEILRCALSPLAAPRPTTDNEVDLRDAPQRDADALVELAARALNTGELPPKAANARRWW